VDQAYESSYSSSSGSCARETQTKKRHGTIAHCSSANTTSRPRSHSPRPTPLGTTRQQSQGGPSPHSCFQQHSLTYLVRVSSNTGGNFFTLIQTTRGNRQSVTVAPSSCRSTIVLDSFHPDRSDFLITKRGVREHVQTR
jgi:hypothetical protein